jgi:hypothetical protein
MNGEVDSLILSGSTTFSRVDAGSMEASLIELGFYYEKDGQAGWLRFARSIENGKILYADVWTTDCATATR